MIDFKSDAKEEEVACNLQNNFVQRLLVSRRRRRKTKRRRRTMGRTYRFCWTRPTFRQAAPIHFMDQQQLKILTNIISSRKNTLISMVPWKKKTLHFIQCNLHAPWFFVETSSLLSCKVWRRIINPTSVASAVLLNHEGLKIFVSEDKYICKSVSTSDADMKFFLSGWIIKQNIVGLWYRDMFYAKSSCRGWTMFSEHIKAIMMKWYLTYTVIHVLYNAGWSIMMKVAFDRSNIGESMCASAELHK